MASFNPSPSSSSVPLKWKYDVFLSFRGEDTRNNFVDHLHAALVQRGIHTFKDDETLRRGNSIPLELLKSIEESRIAVVVFSETYVNSSWCLDELVKIIECRDRIGQKVLPVFYHVDPSDVRKQKIKFATAFQQYKEKLRGKMHKVKRRREALAAAANISGWHIRKTVNRGESAYVEEIMREILGDIHSHGMESNLVGIESHIDALNSLLDTEATEEVRTIGIWGMGGIGKTTIAQAVFKRISIKFEGSSFVNDVRENSYNKRDTCALQEKILRDISMTNVMSGILDPASGANMIRRELSKKKVLLVLDDVDNIKPLEFLAATHEWFGPGSRIIITTRNEHLLSDAHAKYKPDVLHMDQAVELFSRHAFHKNSPPEGYEDLSYRAIHHAGYLPLALKVLGSFFHGRQAGVWESALNRLAKAPNIEIFETLKLSFEGLDDLEKKIFLDIACFFKGKDKEHVTRILDSFGFEPVIGISVLIEKSLVTISKKKLDMHDLIQEMGWQIVRESFTNSRPWQLEEVHDHIRRNGKLAAIEAIALQDKEYNVDNYNENPCSSAKFLESTMNLRLLDVGSEFTYCQPHFLPDELRWLCWHEYPFFSLQEPHMRKLVGLEMFDSAIKNLWDGQKILPNLKFVYLSESKNLTRFPDISGAPNIERLNLSYCKSLVEVHPSLGLHKRLVYLDMSGCIQLECLPSRFEMESLETLILSYCKCLQRFPEVSPCMVKLSYIYLAHCVQIEELPSSIGYLSGLSFLSLIGCANLVNIPTSIGALKHLKSLHLFNCKKLQKLPEEIGSMEKLKELWLGFPEMWKFGGLPTPVSLCTLTNLCSLRKLNLSWRQIEEEDFPENLDAFSSLEELHLSGNNRITQLPASIARLSHLKLLELNKCLRLQSLHLLPSGIQVLKARDCSSLEKIGDLSKEYKWLYKIWLLDCHKLLEDQENERYLDEMLQQSFLQRCAAVSHRLNVAIPGSKIPGWFKEKQQGCNITLKLPPQWHTQIMGFAVCGVFNIKWQSQSTFPRIIFRIVNDEKVIPKSRVHRAYASPAANNWNVWISYIPLGFFQQMYHDFQPEDWYHVQGNLVMSLMNTDGDESVKCGAHIVYKEDVELIPQVETCISDYGHMVHVDGNDQGYDNIFSANTCVYEEKPHDTSPDLMPLRSRMSRWRLMDGISAIQYGGFGPNE